MTPGKIACFGIPGLLFGYPCILGDIGQHRGSVCEGEELSLQELTPQRSLTGWWERVREDGPKTWRWRYFYIDAGLRPRVLTSSTPEKFNEYLPGSVGTTFGCANYKDYPLVVGGSNRAPAHTRTTIVTNTGGCSTHLREGYHVRKDYITSLLDVKRGGGHICFEYAEHDRASELEHKEDVRKGKLATFCFAYDSVKDRIEISYGEDSGNLTSFFYQRRGTATPDPNLVSTQSSQQYSSTADDDSRGATP